MDQSRRGRFSPMSPLGHKRTLRDDRSMSAYPPKADIAGCYRHVRFKRTCVGHPPMSAFDRCRPPSEEIAAAQREPRGPFRPAKISVVIIASHHQSDPWGDNAKTRFHRGDCRLSDRIATGGTWADDQQEPNDWVYGGGRCFLGS